MGGFWRLFGRFVENIGSSASLFIDSVALMSLNCAALLFWNLFKDLLRHTSALLIRNTAVHLFGAVTALLVRSDCALLTTFLVTFQQNCPSCSDVILHTCLLTIFLLFLFYSVIIILEK